MKRRHLLPSQKKKRKTSAAAVIRSSFPCNVSLNRSEEEIKQSIREELLQPDPVEESSGGWHDPQDSPLENYLRLVSTDDENGYNHRAAQSVQDLLQKHEEAIGTLRKARSSVVCDISNVNIGRLETVTKQYVDDNHFLVEPEPGKHRSCVQGQNCLCLSMAARYPDSVEEVNADSNGFVGREFLLPTQLERFQKEGRLPLFQRHCLVCNRALTGVVYTQKLHEGEEPDFMVLDHSYTKLDQPGEYRKNACLSIVLNNQKTTVCKYFVDFSANRYEYVRKRGKRMLVEINVTQQQDFRQAPPPPPTPKEAEGQ